MSTPTDAVLAMTIIHLSTILLTLVVAGAHYHDRTRDTSSTRVPIPTTTHFFAFLIAAVISAHFLAVLVLSLTSHWLIMGAGIVYGLFVFVLSVGVAGSLSPEPNRRFAVYVAKYIALNVAIVLFIRSFQVYSASI